ncbi:biotin-dependent carboxyltransferase family protein [Nocardioides gilvus]|uniref:5-oxoprolinase subunit C family protein n=1 Tax=Nocardioides gilvus TaxID=1735589 RepID=UPI000D74D60D|nr:biotin-dependent carboxyltransferase family protein [Nocardioides gilvus]
MSIRVIDPGPLTTVQDGGRLGWAHLGVPRAGWLDADSAKFANRLVGNAEGAAVLETTYGGVSFVAQRALTFAVTGARCRVTAAGRAVSGDEPVTVRAGAEVVVGPALAGVRSYVALGGGVAVPAVLGSRSRDTLAGIGPEVLRSGAVLALGVAGRPAPLDVPPRDRRSGVLRLHRGPRADWLLEPDALHGASYTVAADSNRVGLRLEGRPVLRRAGELDSEGIVLGAVQVPGSGQPVVFLHDHPTTGGYPVVAVLDPQDLAACAQARPGERFTLRLV